MRATARTAIRGLRANWAFWSALGCSLLAFAWLMFVRWFVVNEHDCAPPTFHPRDGTTVDYSDLLSRHSTKLIDLSNPLFNCAISAVLVILAVALAVISSRRRMIIVVLLPLPVFMCLASGIAVFSCFDDYTELRHLQTVEFDGRIYRLTFASGMAGGMDMYFERLYLFECEPTGDRCRLYETIESYQVRNPEEASLGVDSSLNQLQVRSDGEVVFTVDASSSAPQPTPRASDD